MKRSISLVFQPEGRRAKISSETSIFDAANKIGVSIESDCGGKGICGKCKIVVKKGSLSKLTSAEKRRLSPAEIKLGYRLACRSFAHQNATIFIPVEGKIGRRQAYFIGLEKPVPLDPLVRKFHVLLPKPALSDITPDFERILSGIGDMLGADRLETDIQLLAKLPDLLRSSKWAITVTFWNNRKIIAFENGNTSNKLLGLAIDIGTSKIACQVVDLRTGKTVGVGFTENPQVAFGEDIISRITYAMSGRTKLKALQMLLVDGINRAIRSACAERNLNPNHIYEATIVGNTAMHHFLFALQPKYLALSPYTPVLKRPIAVDAKELHIRTNPNAILYAFPLVAGFVGGDAVADILASGIHDSRQKSLLIDIGTNTEIFVGNSKGILSCSCASGPAFEGGHIKHGMKAVTGAIERIQIDCDSCEVEYNTIDNASPTGLCGSGMIDIAAQLLRCGIINSEGQFKHNYKSSRLRIPQDGDVEFIIATSKETSTGRDIAVTQKDIREIQLAKAAVFAGCSVLMTRANIERESLDRILIAGSFGNCINPENAKILGLIPDVPTEKIHFIGNAAITGAKMALVSNRMRQIAESMLTKVSYLELAVDSRFDTEFANAGFIPHKDMARFPLVRKTLGW